MKVGIAGAVYCALVFALGFALGTLRVLVLAPWLGTWAAVLLEMPVILGASWVVAGRVIAWCAVPPRAADRLAMGGVAFAVLMLAEFTMGYFVFGRGPSQLLARYSAADAQLGLVGQSLFALVPWLRLRWTRP